METGNLSGLERLAADLDRRIDDPDMEGYEDFEGCSRPAYMPTPAQIREECRKIRANWSDKEYRKRASHPDRAPRWYVPTRHVRITDGRRLVGADTFAP